MKGSYYSTYICSKVVLIPIGAISRTWTNIVVASPAFPVLPPSTHALYAFKLSHHNFIVYLT